jgi:aminoglycoside phosphotransferase (APT) family kinase protein
MWSELPGATLHERAVAAEWPTEQLSRTWEHAGQAIAALHRAPVAGVDASHDATAEIATVHRWLVPAMRYGLLPLVDFDRALSALRADAPSGHALLHRDLHDKQLILLPNERFGLIDLDTAAVGEPALDIANVLVHLELRVLQGLLSNRQANAAAEAFIRGAAPGQETMRRIAPYADATRLSLAGVYEFEPRGLIDVKGKGSMPTWFLLGRA